MPHQNRNNIILLQIKSPVSMDGAFDLGYARHEHTKKNSYPETRAFICESYFNSVIFTTCMSL